MLWKTTIFNENQLIDLSFDGSKNIWAIYKLKVIAILVKQVQMHKFRQKLWLWGASIITATIGITANLAQAQVVEECYIITADGEYRDLSSLCDRPVATEVDPIENNPSQVEQQATSVNSPIVQNQINLGYIPDIARLDYGERYYRRGLYPNKSPYYTYYPNVGNEPLIYRIYGPFLPYNNYSR